MNPVAWMIEYAPELRMATFATVVKVQAERIKAERKDDVTVTPLYPLPPRPEASGVLAELVAADLEFDTAFARSDLLAKPGRWLSPEKANALTQRFRNAEERRAAALSRAQATAPQQVSAPVGVEE